MNRTALWGAMIVLMAAAVPGAALAQAATAGASAELVGLLAKELGSTTKQAEGAAGSLFRLAKTRLTPENFAKVADAVPDIEQLLAAAPALDGTSPNAGALGRALGPEGLGGVAQSFGKLGLNRDSVKKAVPVLTDYVDKRGGGGLATLLRDSLR